MPGSPEFRRISPSCSNLEEINHVYISDGGKVKKHKLPQSHWKKSQASKTALDAEKAEKWLDGIFASFEETEYTNDLLSHLRRCLRQSLSFTDFFEYLVAGMFEQDGLILLNSGDPGIRALVAKLCFRPLKVKLFYKKRPVFFFD